jgi:cell division septation protein DedD
MERIKQKLDEARKQRENIQQGNSYSGGGLRDRYSFIPKYNSVTGLNGNRALPVLIAAVIITSAMLVWWLVSNKENRSDPFPRVEIHGTQQTIVAMSTTVEEINNRIAALAVQLDAVSKSIASLETRLTSTQLAINAITTTEAKQPIAEDNTAQQNILTAEKAIESLPPPASGGSKITTSAAKSPHSSTKRATPKTTSTLAMIDNRHTAEQKQPASEASNNGPWVINLVSTSSKIDAERLAKKALSKNIQTEIQKTTVKGTQYWRVQVTGFPTADDAKSFAVTAKKKLGLNDTWIMKR